MVSDIEKIGQISGGGIFFRFALVATVIVVSGVVVTTIFSSFLGNIILEGHRADLIPLIERVAENQFDSAIVFENYRDESSQAQLDLFASNIESLPEVLSISITDKEAILIWTDASAVVHDRSGRQVNEEIIGHSHEPEDIKEAIAMGAFYEVAEDEIKAEFNVDYLDELYVPLFIVNESGKREVIGVANVYFDSTEIVGVIGRLRAMSFALTGLTAGLVMIMMAFAYRRQNRLIKRQAKKLAQYARGLEVMVKDQTQDLKTSEKKYRTMYDSSLDAVMTLDPPDWRFTSGNPSAVKMFGVADESQFIKHAPWEFSPEIQPDGTKSADKAKRMIDMAIKEGSNNFEWTHKSLGGDTFDAVVSLVLIEIDGKKSLQAVVRDISVQKTSAEAVRASEERFRSLALASPDCIKLYDLEGKVTYMSPGGLEEHRLEKPEDAIGLDYLASIDDIDKLAVQDAFNRAKTGETSTLEVKHIPEMSTREQCLMTLAPIKNEDNEITAIFGVSRDITGIKKAERKVQKLDELKSRFITALTHVTRTPLNEMRWNIESLITGEFGPLNEQQNSFLRRALESEKEVLQIITNMNVVLDIERGTMVLEKQPTSLVSLVSAVYQDLKSSCDIRDIACAIVTPKVKIPNALVDVEKIRRVIEILLENAIAYTRKEGKIRITFGYDKSSIKIKIKDTGVGIPKSEQDSIFDRFYRASNSQMMYPNGIGLGLYIVKSIVEEHGGNITFKSEENVGTEFVVTLPIK